MKVALDFLRTGDKVLTWWGFKKEIVPGAVARVSQSFSNHRKETKVEIVPWNESAGHYISTRMIVMTHPESDVWLDVPGAREEMLAFYKDKLDLYYLFKEILAQ